MNLLVVHADPRIATLLRRGFSADGHRVEIAPDAATMMSTMAASKFDAVIADAGADAADGAALCRSLRASNDWTPLLVLVDHPNDGAALLDAGADDALSKPFSLVTVEARLRSLLREPADQRRHFIVDDLELDVSRRRCERNGAPISLTPTEFNILELLMRRRGEPVSKADILAHIWDYEYRGNPNIVEVYVSTLRRKVDQPFERRNLCTVWGIGYEIRGASPATQPAPQNDAPSQTAPAMAADALAGASA